LCQIVVVVVVCGPISLFRAPTQNNFQKLKKMPQLLPLSDPFLKKVKRFIRPL